MALIQLRNIRLSYGETILLDGVNLQIEPGERVCLVGRNGAGKSTLLKVVSGELLPDDGNVIQQDGIHINLLSQEVPQDLQGKVFNIVADGLGTIGELLSNYHAVSARLAQQGGDVLMRELAHIQHALEARDGWRLHQRVETVVSRLGLDADAEFAHLSGGVKRRVLLAKALASEPELLLLDEPTNHLDIQSIAWLEEFLNNYTGAILFITHDRMFLQNLATRIIDLDRSKLTSWPGDYKTYLERKQSALAAEETQQKEFDKKLAQEEAWIRQGIKARRTRNEGRVRALQAMRAQYSKRRARVGKVQMQTLQAERSGKLVIEAEGISHEFAGRDIIKNFSTVILRGDKVGIVGPNGSGKTTLLRILLGQLTPQSGTVKLGTNLSIAYFDQMRSQLEEDKSVAENIGEGRDQVTVQGKPRHILSYLQDFLFSPERSRTPMSVLSGGERNRALLARLFLKPSNVLVLDEPTNDLDVETLELLEELLVDYNGTVLLVSHDRSFLNNVVTSTVVFEGNGIVREYVGGYDDWLRQKSSSDSTNAFPSTAAIADEKPVAAAEEKKTSPVNRPRKLSYKEQRELEELPLRIEALEREQKQLHEQMGDAAFYQQDSGRISAAKTRLEQLEQELNKAYLRWESLEES